MRASRSPNIVWWCFGSGGNTVRDRRLTRRGLHFVVSVVALVAAGSMLDWQALRETLGKVDPVALGLIVGVSFCQFVVMSLRWRLLLRNIVTLPLREHFRLYFQSVFLNTFTPANVGGDVYRLMTLKAYTSSHTAVLAALLQERYLGLLGFIGVYLGCWAGLQLWPPQGWHEAGTLFGSVGVCMGGGLIGLLLAPGLLQRLLRRGDKCLPVWLRVLLGNFCAMPLLTPWARSGRLLGASCLGVLIWVLTVSLMARDLGIAMPWLTLAMVVVLVECLRLVPISIQGIGIRESAYAYLFGVLGASSESGFILGTMSYVVLNLSICLAGILGLSLLRRDATPTQRMPTSCR